MDLIQKNVGAKLNNIKQLEKRQKDLVHTSSELGKQTAKCRDLITLAQLIWDLHISRSELISFKVAVNEAVATYGLDPSADFLLR